MYGTDEFSPSAEATLRAPDGADVAVATNIVRSV